MDEENLRAEKSHFQVSAARELQSLVEGFEAKTGEKLRDVYVTIIDKNTDVAVPPAVVSNPARAVCVSVRLEPPSEDFEAVDADDSEPRTLEHSDY